MNILCTPLADSILVDGKTYPIRTDFKTWLLVDALLTNDAISDEKKLVFLFDLCFVEKKLPNSLTQTLEALFDFYAGGVSKETGKGTNLSAPIFSFSYDAPYIYAAVLSQYGVDLVRENPHWFLFCAMLKGLLETHPFSKILAYRSMKLSDIKDSKMRAHCRDLKERYRLPERRSQKELLRATAEGLSKLM